MSVVLRQFSASGRKKCAASLALHRSSRPPPGSSNGDSILETTRGRLLFDLSSAETACYTHFEPSIRAGYVALSQKQASTGGRTVSVESTWPLKCHRRQRATKILVADLGQPAVPTEKTTTGPRQEKLRHRAFWTEEQFSRRKSPRPETPHQRHTRRHWTGATNTGVGGGIQTDAGTKTTSRAHCEHRTDDESRRVTSVDRLTAKRESLRKKTQRGGRMPTGVAAECHMKREAKQCDKKEPPDPATYSARGGDSSEPEKDLPPRVLYQPACCPRERKGQVSANHRSRWFGCRVVTGWCRAEAAR